MSQRGVCEANPSCDGWGLSRRLELQSHPVDAVAESRGPGAVFEDVALMAAATAAMDFGPHHAVRVVAKCPYGLVADWLPEAGPAGAAFIFGAGVEQVLIAPGAGEDAPALLL